MTDNEVGVGRDQALSSERVQAFMEYLQKRYAMAEKQASLRIIAIASAHHRLNDIHPFPDGNRRVSRLMSHAMALRSGIVGNGLWSISRGLARGLKHRGEYERLMDYAETPRQGDRDGFFLYPRSRIAEWFLTVALDQVRFSAVMFDLGRLEARYRSLVKDVVNDERAPDLISAVLRHRSLPRGEANCVLKTSERTARNALSELVGFGILKWDTAKAQYSFPPPRLPREAVPEPFH